MAKFKVGDKVKIPKTKSTGDPIEKFQKGNQDYKKDYFIIEGVWESKQIKIKRDDSIPLKYFMFEESDLELYEESSFPQLEIGQWYKATNKNSNNVYYLKIKEIKSDRVRGDYVDLQSKTWWNATNFPFIYYTFEKINDKNIKEIQDYLPDNHEDKQQSNLVKGRYYSFDYYGDIYWFRFERLENTTIYCSAYRYRGAYSKWEERITNLVDLKDAKNLKEVTEQEAKGIFQESPESLVGRWIKIIKNPYGSTNYTKVGNYLKITKEEKEKFYTICQKNKKEDFWSRNRFKDDPYFELMPVGFNPETENTEWIPKVGEWAYVLGIGHTENNDSFPKGTVFQIIDVQKRERGGYYIYVNKKNNPFKIGGTCSNSKDCRKALPHEIPNSEIEYADLSKCKIFYNGEEIYPIKKSLENEEIVLKTAKKPKISVNINVKNVKYPEIKIPINIIPKKANKIILKNFNLTI